ncbi:MAG: 30S ribosomal protein S1 [Clostridia bacterium]|nr:30S ribosomal protein S1 [Clostridia bacterium]
MHGKVNKIVQFKVKDIKKEDIAILSRKAVGQEALMWVKEELKEGAIVYGIVRNIRPYGVFIEIGGGVVGLLHIEDISIARIKTPEERFRIGQKIKVMVKCIDKSKQRVVLTYKELLGTWEENVKDFSEGDIVEGIAREAEKQKNGIFVELKPNLVGLADFKENIQYGQKVQVSIRKIIPEKKKVKLVFM